MRQARRVLLGSALLPGGVITAITLLPKSPEYAASDRFAMTAVTLGTAIGGCVGLTMAWRRYRDAAVVARYPQATRLMKDTMKFLLGERELARKGRLPLLAVTVASPSLYILGHWPQLELLAPFKGGLITLGMVSGALLVAQPIYVRRHIINSLYLGRYYFQQAQHIGPSVKLPARVGAKDEEPVGVIGRSRFRAGGFDWEFADHQKNTLIVGQPGSGKSVAVGNGLLHGMLASGGEEPKIAGIILDPKGTYREEIVALCQRLGRMDDLYIMSPRTWKEHARTAKSIAWNPLDTDDDALEIAARFATVMKLVGGMQTKDTFFVDAARIFLRHAITLTRQAAAPEIPSLVDLLKLCAEPVDKATEYERLIAELGQKFPTAPPQDVEMAVAYFETEWRNMPPKQQAGVRSVVVQLLDDFTVEPIASMTSGRSTMSPGRALDEGKLIYLDFPLAEWERISRVMTALMKLDMQREVLRRPRKDRPSMLFADEFQAIFVSGEEHGDSDFFERSRESNHANIIATQNISSFLKKTQNRHDVTNFLGLCAVKIFLRNSERETNEWASNLFGERSEIAVTASEAARLESGLSHNQTSYNRSTRVVRIVPPEAFTELAVPDQGKPEANFTESIVHLGSRAEMTKLDLAWRVHPLTE
jgi:hypothetical protein